MNLAVSLCYLLNRGKPRIQKQADRVSSKPVYSPPAELLEKRSRLRNPEVDFSKYEQSIFVSRYRHRLDAYRFIGDHESVFRDKVVLDLGSGRGEGILHLVLDKRVKFAIGVDIEKDRCEFAEQMLRDYQIENAKILCKDASNMPEIESNSVDVIVSAATFEHIKTFEPVLKEAHRILKPGGLLYAQFSPIWTNYSGSHLGKWLPFPWTHLLFSPTTVAKTLEAVTHTRQDAGQMYSDLNCFSLKQYREAARNSRFEIVYFANVSQHPVKKIIVKLPVLGEYISGGTVMFLRK